MATGDRAPALTGPGVPPAGKGEGTAESTTFAERARAAQQRQGPVCTMGAALDLMPPGYRAEVTSALRTPGINATTIATLLQADGYEVKADAVRRHRIRILGGQGCGCPVA